MSGGGGDRNVVVWAGSGKSMRPYLKKKDKQLKEGLGAWLKWYSLASRRP
jgi:hypothetical protein